LLSFYLGILLAPLVQNDRYKIILIICGVFLILFFALRLFFFYSIFNFGNIRDLSNEGNGYFNFFGLCKYPPSITFVLWTCGINLLILCLIKKIINPRFEGKLAWKLILLLGQCSLFFYLINLPILAFLALPYPKGVSHPGFIYLLLVNFLMIITPLCYVFQEFMTHNF